MKEKFTWREVLIAGQKSSFGDEWSKFDQSQMSKEEAKEIFEKYFSIFPWHNLPKNSEGFDMGCGSGRWASFVAPRVSILHCIDPSSALDIAKLKLKKFNNINFYNSSVDDVKFTRKYPRFWLLIRCFASRSRYTISN